MLLLSLHFLILNNEHKHYEKEDFEDFVMFGWNLKLKDSGIKTVLTLSDTPEGVKLPSCNYVYQMLLETKFRSILLPQFQQAKKQWLKRCPT